ncbi:MAG: CobD/CbiB family protein [Burkholderiales bacterium]|nr:CobD/CbiB family protein [Burkholderiales bacterium]
MAFFTILLALLIENARPLPWAGTLLDAYHRYTDRLAHDLNAGQRVHGVIGWCAAVVPWVLLVLLVFYALHLMGVVLGWVWTLLVLYACLGFREAAQPLRDIFDAMRAGDIERARALLATWRGEQAGAYGETEIAKAAIETALVRAHRQVFGVIFWFILLPGPAGALLYRLSEEMERRWGRRQDEAFGAFGEFSAKAFRVLDWLPVRLSAVGFAIAGNFEDAISAWRTQARSWLNHSEGIVLASGAGALGVRLGGALPGLESMDFRPELGEGEVPDSNYLQNALSLLWRTLIVWLVLLLLLTLASWVGT